MRRTARVLSRFAIAVACVITGGGCHRAPSVSSASGVSSVSNASSPSSGVPGDAATAVDADSAEGIVRVVGVGAAPQTVLVTDDGKPALTLTGSSLVARVAGLRIVASGARAGRQFSVSRFRVVSAGGIVATDGMLSASGDVLTIVTAGGQRFVLGRPTSGLHALVGHRVWVSGPLDQTTVAYGLID